MHTQNHTYKEKQQKKPHFGPKADMKIFALEVKGESGYTSWMLLAQDE